MADLATRRLIDAAANLDPADRALLNLWVNRGLDDERLTGLTGMSTEALHGRREKIVARLAADLGLPEQDVRVALDQISPNDESLKPSIPDGAAAITASSNGLPAITGSSGQEETPAPTPEPAPAAEPPHRRRRGRWIGLAALGVIAVAVIVIVAGRGSSTPTSHPAASTESTPTTSTAAPTVASPARPTGNPVPAPLAGLPGGLARAAGSVKLAGPVKHLRLKLTVRGLPAARRGHYEVWLYNSVLDSRPLARLRTGHHRLTARLPRTARRYRWIDISFQPLGVVNHSGESELRASNPAHTTMARLRTRSARTRHRLRQAAKVSAAHPAGRHRVRHRRTARHPAKGHGKRVRAKARDRRHGGLAHRPKRSARGSSQARTSK
jgi:hypothetical protein